MKSFEFFEDFSWPILFYHLPPPQVIVVGVESDESTKDFLETVAKADNIFNQVTLTAKKFSELPTIGKKLENKIGFCGKLLL